MIKKLCSYPGCHKVVEAGVKYCDKHRETDRKKYREYKQRRMRDEQEARRQQFYNSKAWEQFRAAQAAAQLGIDIYEYYTSGRIIDAENYHHIQEITEAWARRLDAANVIGLSEANHRRIHKEYDRSYKASLRPNPYMTAIDMWKAVEATRQHEGISAIAKQYGRNGEIEALYPCTVEGITVDDAGLLKSKLRHKALVDYRIVGSSFTDSGFYEDLLIFKGFTMDGINTKPIREIVKGTIEGQIKAQNYLNTLYDNGLTNKLVVQLTSDIKDEKELRKTQEKFGRLYSKGKRIFTVPAGFSAVYGGLSSTRGKAVPAAQLGGKRHTVDKVQTNKGVQEAKLKGINSWVAVASLTAV